MSVIFWNIQTLFKMQSTFWTPLRHLLFHLLANHDVFNSVEKPVLLRFASKFAIAVATAVLYTSRAGENQKKRCNLGKFSEINVSWNTFRLVYVLKDRSLKILILAFFEIFFIFSPLCRAKVCKHRITLARL